MRAKRSAPGRISVGFAIVLALFAAAPTVGDVGSCGQKAEPLDAKKFFTQRLDDTCARCEECDFHTPACKRACDKGLSVPVNFPPGCHPIVHDGEVCLRALAALSCEAFLDVVSTPPIVPTECDFCPAEDSDGGAP